ncbi:MAG TPA: hypothetical protein VGV92_00925 [Gammaproteobacteria bacterium]|nr:hypothetical protein [Gammaproteobacteria bacterium]
MKELFKALLIQKTRELQTVLTLDHAQRRAFKKAHGVRSQPTSKLPPIPALPQNKVPDTYALIAHIINYHSKNKGLLVVEAVGDNLVIHYNDTKVEVEVEVEVERAKALLDEVLKIWTPLETWQLMTVEKQRYLQCTGFEYLPHIISLFTNKTVKQLSQDYALETIESAVDNGVICRRIVDSTRISVAAKLVTATQTPVDNNTEFMRIAIHVHGHLFFSEAPELLKPKVQSLNKFILNCFEFGKSAQKSIEDITRYCETMAERDSDLDLFLLQKNYLKTMLATFHDKRMIDLLNDHANTPTDLLDAVVVGMLKRLITKMHKNPQPSFELLTLCAPEISVLFAFYLNTEKSADAKDQLTQALLNTVMQKYIHCLEALDPRENTTVETTLCLSAEFTKKLCIHAKNLWRDEDALTAHFAALKALMKYYRTTQDWTKAKVICDDYIKLLPSAPPEVTSGTDRRVIKLSIRLEFAFAQGYFYKALDYYKSLSKYPDEVFLLATWGDDLVCAFAKTRDYLDVLNTGLKTLALLLPKHKDNADVIAFQETCDALKRKHLPQLISCDPGRVMLDEETLNVILVPPNREDLDYYQAALATQKISATLDDNGLVLIHPHTVSAKKLKSALHAAPRLKERKLQEEEEEEEEEERKAQAEETTAVLQEKSAVLDNRLLHVLTGVIGTQKKKSDKKPKAGAASPENYKNPHAFFQPQEPILVWRLKDPKGGYACFVEKDATTVVFDFSAVREKLNAELTANILDNQFKMGRPVGQFGVFKRMSKKQYELKLAADRVDFIKDKTKVKIVCGDGLNEITKEIPVYRALTVRKK